MRDEIQDRLADVAAAVADWQPLDWNSVESSAGNATERALIRRLRAISEIGRFHSDLTFDNTTSRSTSLDNLLPQAESENTTPVSWGPLKILERVGRGRFGDVFRAWDPNLDREVALKLLKRREVDPVGEDRIVVEEGRLMARVRHPNVVTIYGAQRIDGRTGLWMEFVPGRTLEAELKERGRFEAGEITKVGVELCRALGAVHAAGLVHRDVKAQNVLRDRQGHVLLGDFGTGHELDDGETSRDDIAGTPAYLAPEIFRGAAATPQSDLYSLGALLFHLATGSYPVCGRSMRELRRAHENGEHLSIRVLRPDLPGPLASAFDTALERDPARRFESAAAMERALTATASPQVQPDQSQFPNRVHRRVAFGGIAAGAIGAVVWLRAPWILFESGRGGSDTRLTRVSSRTNSQTLQQVSTDPSLVGLGVPLGAVSPDGRILTTVRSRELALYEIATRRQWLVTGPESGDPSGFVVTSRFSRDGSRLTYLRYALTGPPIPEIRVVSTNGGPSRLIWRGSDARGHEVRLQHWSGDDNLLLAARQVSPSETELLVISSPTGEIKASFRIPSPWRFGATLWLVAATLSPDGRFVAYNRRNESTGQNDIHLHDIHSDSDVPLVSDASNNHSPIWTRDGSHLFFLSNRSGTTDLWAKRVDRPQTGPFLIEEGVGPAYPMGGPTEGGSLFFRRAVSSQELYLVDIDPNTLEMKGEPQTVPSKDSMNGVADFSPDGRQLAFGRARDDRGSLIIRSLDNGQEREVRDPLFGGGTRPRWEPGARSILLTAQVDGRGALRRVDIDTGRISTVMEALQYEWELLPHGDAFLYSNRATREVIKRSLRTQQETVVHRVLPQGTLVEMGVSREGDRLAYSSPIGDGSAWVLVIANLSSPQDRREVFRVPQGEYLQMQTWSPDGREVIVSRADSMRNPPTGKSRLWAIDVRTGSARPLGPSFRGIFGVRISPDGRKMALNSGVAVQEIWKIDNVLAALKS
ncbi:MAG TPA: protein kinase [Chloroflexota bacterium]|nr:protein kinase [Chloroflexota bacterium]